MEAQSQSKETNGKLEVLLQAETPIAALTFRISDDKLKLFLDGQLKEGQEKNASFTKEDILSLLPKTIDSSFLEKSLIENCAKMIREGKPVRQRRIAKGIPVENGKPGRVVFLVKKYDPKLFEQLADSEDLRNRHTFDNIEQGAEIVRIYPPTIGREGKDLFGKTIPAKLGEVAKVVFDSTIALKVSEKEGGYNSLLANVSGYLWENKSKLQISQALRIPGNIDYRSGNLDFIGSIEIDGNVEKDFIAYAEQDIHIRGDVDSGFVKSIRGSVNVDGNVVGAIAGEIVDRIDKRIMRKPTIQAGLSIKLLRAQNAVLSAIDVVEILKETLNSVVRTKKYIMMKEGQVLGSVLYLAEGGEFKILGSEAGSKTVIHLMHDVESSSEYEELLQSIVKHEEAIELLALQVGQFAEFPELMAKVEEEQRTKLAKRVEKLVQLRSGKDSLEQNRQKFLAEANRNQIFTISFHDRLFPGVEIHAGNQVFCPDQELVGPATIEYKSDQGEFVVTEFRSLEPIEKNEGEKEELGVERARTGS